MRKHFYFYFEDTTVTVAVRSILGSSHLYKLRVIMGFVRSRAIWGMPCPIGRAYLPSYRMGMLSHPACGSVNPLGVIVPGTIIYFEVYY